MDSVRRMSNLSTSAPLIIVPLGERESVRAFGTEMLFHLTGKQTAGRSAIATSIIPPHNPGPPPHRHEREDEIFFVQEGRMAFLVDGTWQEVPEGATVFAPKMSIHSLKNLGDTPARVLTMMVPAGFEVFFARCANEFAKPGAPDLARIVEISAEHGIHYVKIPGTNNLLDPFIA
jgi:mannose-6-phosphate isomerase-like protein (cupin superfamily)